MRRILTDIAAKKAKPQENGKPKKYSDGGGLHLYVTNASKCWRYKYRKPTNGKEQILTIGKYPEIGLREARQLHEEARDLLARGIDPNAYKKTTKAANLESQSNSFEAVAFGLPLLSPLAAVTVGSFQHSYFCRYVWRVVVPTVSGLRIIVMSMVSV